MIQLDLNKDSGIALDLTKASPGLKKVRVVLNWDEHPVHASSTTQGFDLDLWAFALDTNGKIASAEQICYFNQKSIYNNAVVLPRDNRTGAGADDEEIIVDILSLPTSVGSVAIYAFVFEAAKRGQHFGMVANSNVQMINADTNEVIAQYNITQDCNGETAMYIGSVDRTSFTPDGGAGNMDPNQVISHYQ